MATHSSLVVIPPLPVRIVADAQPADGAGAGLSLLSKEGKIRQGATFEKPFWIESIGFS